MSGITLQRWRSFDYRVVPTMAWLLLGLAALDFVVRFADGAFNPWFVPSQLGSAAVFVFAAALLVSNRPTSLIAVGGLALAVPALFQLGRAALVDLAPQLLPLDLLDTVGAFTWLLTLGGLLAIGVAVGGIHARVGFGALMVGVAVSLAGVAWSLSNLQPFVESMPAWQFVSNLGGPWVVAGWAFVLGAAIERRFPVIAAGAAIIVALDAWNILTTYLAPFLTTYLAPFGPGTNFDLVNAVTGSILLAAWAMLVAGALTELRQPSPRQAAAPA